MTWQGKTISVILPTYNERDSIRRVIRDFVATGVVDEVLVVNNNAAPGTSDEVAAAAAESDAKLGLEVMAIRPAARLHRPASGGGFGAAACDRGAAGGAGTGKNPWFEIER